MELDLSNAKSFNISLKQAVKKATGLTVKVRIINSYNFPKCWVELYSRDIMFSNAFRLKVFDSCGFNRNGLLNINDVSYGNIRCNMISAHVHEWLKVFENEN